LTWTAGDSTLSKLNNPIDNKIIHDKLWGDVYEYARSQIDSDEDLLTSWTNTNLYEMQKTSHDDRGNKRDMRHIPYILKNQLYYACAEDYLQIKLNVLTEALLGTMSESVDLVVDLGSGWGRNSVYLSHLLGPDYKFLACELSDSGRHCTDYFAAAYDLPITTLPFNYYDNATLVSHLQEDSNLHRVLFFSSYSIEQITTLGIEFFDSLLKIDIPEMHFVHLEPVSWQITRNPKNTADYYNNDLISLIHLLEDLGRAEIIREEANFYGHRPDFDAALIEWRKK